MSMEFRGNRRYFQIKPRKPGFPSQQPQGLNQLQYGVGRFVFSLRIAWSFSAVVKLLGSLEPNIERRKVPLKKSTNARHSGSRAQETEE